MEYKKYYIKYNYNVVFFILISCFKFFNDDFFTGELIDPIWKSLR